MAAHDMLVDLIRNYFIDLGYNPQFIVDYFSKDRFSEVASIRLANANVMIKNKSDRTSHQTHIAVTGEMIDYFYSPNVFSKLDTETIEHRKVFVSSDNIKALKNMDVFVKNAFEIPLIEGTFTIGKRTQNQLQLSKKNSLNSQCFNELRLGLYENDLLMLLKFRSTENSFAVGIPQTFYLDIIPNYADKYETNTYLRIPAV